MDNNTKIVKQQLREKLRYNKEPRILVADVRAVARYLDFVVRRTNGEWRISRRGWPESRVYYTTDNADALNTLNAMAKEEDD